ncbi:MAG: hypothetical protein RR436_03480 [Clostridia bacterium]
MKPKNQKEAWEEFFKKGTIKSYLDYTTIVKREEKKEKEIVY